VRAASALLRARDVRQGGLILGVTLLALAGAAGMPAAGVPEAGSAPSARADEGAPAGGSARAAGRRCRLPNGLRPAGRLRNRFTMLLRIKNFDDVAAYANPDQDEGGLKGRLRRRDVFVINTRRKWATPEREAELVTQLRRSFPCNRIIALNGIARRPRSPGYMLSLADDRRVQGLMLDWESDDWRVAKAIKRKMPTWTTEFRPSRRRIARNLGHLVRKLKRSGRGGKTIGMALVHYTHWNYSKLALTINRRSRRLRRSRRGIQSIQLQKVCQQGARNYGRAIRRLNSGYRHFGLDRRRLAVQISFTNDPIARDSRPVNSVRPRRAARCTRRALRHRGGAVLYWAKPAAVRAMLKRRFLCRLRPPSQGRGAC
jgi:hypothetical protein